MIGSNEGTDEKICGGFGGGIGAAGPERELFIGKEAETDVAVDLVNASAPETRVSLAAQALYERVPDVKNWEIVAGYLLYDHTVSTKSRSRSKQ